jgi:TM2 domain-containing membrane protein YozV
VFSVIGFFLSIVECTNLFLTYKKEANALFLNFGIVTIFVILLNILTLIWALRQTERVNKDDENESTTDTPFT